MDEQKSKGRGGRREGSGRKPLVEGQVMVDKITLRAPQGMKSEIEKRGGNEWVRQVIARAIHENW